MIILTHLAYDVNDELAWREEREDLWEQEPAYVPTQYDRLVEAGMSPEGAAPALLAACEAVVKEIETDDVAYITMEYIDAMLPELKAAIAAARPETTR